jgi:hypothetical protein
MRTKNPEVIASTFIPGTQLLRPTIDHVFKRMMQNNPAAIKSLLTAVFPMTEFISSPTFCALTSLSCGKFRA